MARTYTVDHLRVRFHDVDHAGIIFFAKIYEYCHVAYEEFLEDVVGYDPQAFFKHAELGAPLVATSSEHLHPLRHGDRMVIHCDVEALGRSSLKMAYRVDNQDGTLCARVTCTHAFISLATFKSIPIPDDIRGPLAPYVRDAGITSGPPP